MERDFLGLSSKESLSVGKDEFKDVGRDAAFLGNSGSTWTSFSSKASIVPQFMSFTTSQEERPKKLVFDPDALSAFQQPTGGPTQKSFTMERQNTHFTLAPYLAQHVDAHGVSALRSREIKRSAWSNHSTSVAVSSPFHHKVHGINTTVASMKHHALGGIPVTNPHSVTAMGSTAGTYALRSHPKPSTGSPQLTIFYGGTVNVFDDISVEKAHAIMFLAGNGHTNQNPKTLMQTSAPVKPEPCLSSPISDNSHSNASGSGSSLADDLMATKSKAALTAPGSQPDPPQQIPMSTPAALIQTAVPQARNASLARFLEKRKERLTKAAPYTLSMKPAESASESEAPVKSPSPSAGQLSSKDTEDSTTFQTKLEI